MPDYGARVADKAIRDTERKLRTTYGTAKRELQKKLKDFNDKYKAKDAAKRQQLVEGKITRQQYADWKAGQVFQRKQWEAKVKEVASVMAHSNEQAAKIINEGRLDVFSENYNFSAFLGEQQLGISFDVYNTQAVARLIQDDPQILPEWKIDEEKDYEWNAKKVNNIVQQGIIQGEGIPEMTKRLCNDLVTQNQNKMRMFARTAITGAQNAGRQKQMEDAAEMGIQVEKQWIATLDSRTRDWHRDRDGETVPYNEEFSGGLEYPGDPAGDPADVYNCRCTMITVYPEHAAYHEGGTRRASAEWTDEDGTKHQQSYLTVNPNIYEGWSEKAYRYWLDHKSNTAYQKQTEEISLETVDSTQILPQYPNEMSEKGYVGLSGEESDKFMEEHHNKRIIGKHGENTMMGDQSRRINEALRNGEMPSNPKDAALVKRLDEEIKKNHLSQDMTLFRGVTFNAFKNTGVFDGFYKTANLVNMSDFKDASGKINFDAWSAAFSKAQKADIENVLERAKGLIGKQVKDDGFMQVSASSQRNIFGFSDVNIQLHAKEGTNAYISDYLSESEIILQRGTEIRIVGAEIATVKAENGNSMDILQIIAEIAE